jgi:Trp operon repressor
MYFNEALQKVVDLLSSVPSKDLSRVLEDILTPAEISEVGERIALLEQLKAGKTQRDIAEDLGMSVTTVSRGSRVLKYGTGTITKYI